MRLFRRSIKDQVRNSYGVSALAISKMIGFGMLGSKLPGKEFRNGARVFYAPECLEFNGSEFRTTIGKEILLEADSFDRETLRFNTGWTLNIALKRLTHRESLCNLVPGCEITERINDLSNAQIEEEARRLQANRSAIERASDEVRQRVDLLQVPSPSSQSIFTRFRLQAEYTHALVTASQEPLLPSDRSERFFS